MNSPFAHSPIPTSSIPTSSILTSSISTLAQRILSGIVLCLFCLPSSAITLTRCKIDDKIVYSDTDCPERKPASRKGKGQSEFSSGPASRPVTVKLPRKQSVGMTVPRKARTSRAGK